MNKERFEELSEALRQAKAVRRGETAPARVLLRVASRHPEVVLEEAMA